MSVTTDSRVIRRLAFVPGQLVSTTATNPDPAWVNGSTYALGARVTHSITSGYGFALPHQFERLIAGNTGTPGVDSDKWLNLGPANTVAMFDVSMSRSAARDWPLVARKTSQAGSLEVVIEPGLYVNTLALFGLEGESITVDVMEGATVVSTRTKDLASRQVGSLLEYLWTPFVQVDRALFEGLDVFPGRRVRISMTGAVCAIGASVIGTDFFIGSAPYWGAEWAQKLYLSADRDSYGNLKDVYEDAPWSDDVNLSVQVPKSRITAVKQALTEMRQVPTVWLCNAGDSELESLFFVLAMTSGPRIVAERVLYGVLALPLIGLA